MKSALIVDFNASEYWGFYRAIQEASGNRWDLIRAVATSITEVNTVKLNVT